MHYGTYTGYFKIQHIFTDMVPEDLLRSLNDDQKAAVRQPFSYPLIVQAGPGSGKTLTVTSRIIEAVFSQQQSVSI